MEIRNNPIPSQTQSFTGIRINTSEMNTAQKNISRAISNMLDYTDEYVKSADTVDVFMLPGRSKNSVIVKYMDKFSDMFYKNGNRQVSTRINVSKPAHSKTVDEIREKLNEIQLNKYTAPDFDATKIMNQTTDLAKIDADSYDKYFEYVDDFEEIYGRQAAKEVAVDDYQSYKRQHPNSECAEF